MMLRPTPMLGPTAEAKLPAGTSMKWSRLTIGKMPCNICYAYPRQLFYSSKPGCTTWKNSARGIKTASAKAAAFCCKPVKSVCTHAHDELHRKSHPTRFHVPLCSIVRARKLRLQWFFKIPQTFSDFYKTWRGIESTFNWTHPKLKQLIPLLLHALLLMHSNAIFTSLGFYQQFALASLTDSLAIFRPTRAVTHWNPLTQNWGVVTRCKTGNNPTEINAPSTARCKHSLCSSKMYNQKTLAPTSLYLSKWKIWTRSNHSHKPTQIMWRLQAGTTKQANIQAIASAHSITIGYNWIQLAHIQDSTSWCQECISLVKKSQNGRWT